MFRILMSNPPIPPALTNCGGVITDATTREDLLARGFKSEAIDEVFAFRDRLRHKASQSALLPPPPE